MRKRSDLHDYQQTAYDHFLTNPRSAGFIDLGLGKTAITLTLLSDILQDFDAGQALVIAPIRVAKATWPTEIHEWEHTAWLEHTLIRAEDQDEDVKAVFDRYRTRFLQGATLLGIPPASRSRLASAFAAEYRDRYKKEKRARLARTPTPLHIIGLPQVEWLVKFHGKRWPYKTVIVDEASAFKEFSTARWKALNSVFKYIDRMHLLTASPAAETWMSLWAIVGLLDRGERLGRKISHYREKYFDHNSYTYSYTLKHTAREKISEAISDICLVMKAEDHLPLSAPNYLNRYIELPEHLIEKYDEFVVNSILEFGDAEIEAVNGAVLVNKLLQFTGGAVLDDERQVHEIHDEKIEDVAELVEELDGEPLIIAYWYKSSLARLKKRFPQAVTMDKGGKAIADWNAGKIPILLLHPASAGHGLNLQHGGHDIAFFDIPWSAELFSQTVGRLARQGQKKVVRVHHLIVRRTPDPRWTKRQREDAMTADEIVMAALAEKGEGQAALFRYIRAMRDRARASHATVSAGSVVLGSGDSNDEL